MLGRVQVKEPMRPKLLQWLCCPRCKSDLRIAGVSAEWVDDIVEGVLICTGCDATYPIARSIPRFVESDSYSAPFSFEWSIHRRTQFVPESLTTFIDKIGHPSELDGKLALDAGCGTGRFTDVIADNASDVVAFDLSGASVEVARENLRDRTNVHFVQASITEIPFKPVFDFVLSIGVIQHTPNPRESFLSVARAVRPGGEIAIYVYSGHDPTQYAVADKMRLVTTRMSRSLLYKFSHAAIPLYYLYRIPGVGPVLSRLLKISVHSNPSWRVLDTFNWYAPTYQFKHRYYEVYEWFAAAGITAVSLRPQPIGMRGRRPESAEDSAPASSGAATNVERAGPEFECAESLTRKM